MLKLSFSVTVLYMRFEEYTLECLKMKIQILRY